MAAQQQNKPRIAFFGATGGCTLSTLTHSLLSNHTCTALARTPSKLQKLLQDRNVPTSTISQNLTIIQGDVTDLPAVRRTLQPDPNTPPADVVISGIGAYPKFQWSLFQPITLTDPHVCEEATKTYVKAMDAVYGAGKGPHFVMVSTTGISSKQRDVPLALYPLYRYGLQVPHADKEAAERILVAQMGAGRCMTSVRASLLMDGPGKGLEGVREGWEWGAKERGEKEEGPAIGYSIAREDVGFWIFERIVKGDGSWGGKMVTITS